MQVHCTTGAQDEKSALKMGKTWDLYGRDVFPWLASPASFPLKDTSNTIIEINPPYNGALQHLWSALGCLLEENVATLRSTRGPGLKIIHPRR